ncbi:hypothetical protein UFOVP964_34 [uncultured Caudovirales phage]|uniref:Gp5/Type VI secretion system Vgr protein OB-fold domain-containing protein n=1 Tax=uncultured Caudovirales phage TaxID=2100421 RepID=A0A6J5Q4C9_9CAUD|nr:hypothetical protein UFOVP854_34 [uncultured Caudovirales phage]CAB4174224.1 hypothetical protein UFOVP964_34 [uncultured Caudovirales phage]CAB4179490.1 hypothetical protein UFOVP1034_124 [uncultured Caudovirales phage]CAB4189168.1 hypothetical protein UFOVP1177_124 [uncultured Caudovirales phage]CAB4193597.1 hypothetical protein UFOVP1243_111 [uncultured Caudovirales phage]
MVGTKILPGVYRAVVKDSNDPQRQGKIKVEIQTNQGHTTNWVWPMHPSSITPESPEKNQGVWVFFNGADPDHPVWFGAFGKHIGNSKKVYIKPLANSVDVSSYTTIKLNTMPDGTIELDLVDSLVAMATMLKDHETRITSIESQLVTLHSTLGTRTAPSHTHGSNG